MRELRRLSRRRSARVESGTFLIDGPLLLDEAVSAGVDLRTVFVEPPATDHPAVRRARQQGAEVKELAEGTLARALDLVTPQAVVAVAARREATVDQVLDASVRRGRPVIALISLQDPGNAGTLVRIAEAAGCAGVVLTSSSVDIHNPKAVRATAGALFRLPVAEGVEPSLLLSSARRKGLPTWATVRSGGTVVHDADLAGPSVLLIGSESHGLTEAVRAAADGAVSIPMDGGVESLNAAVAGALVAFEAARQRRALRSRPDGAVVEQGGGQRSLLGHDVARPGAPGTGPTDPGPDARSERRER